MSRPTLYTEEGPGPAGRVELDPAERRHARSLRLAPGDELRLTDGAGMLWRARVEEPLEDGAPLRVMEELPAPADLPVELAFGVARKSRTLWLVEKAVEFGVATLQPLECARSRSVADAARSEGFWRKARRRAVSALKQCGGARLPRIRRVLELEEYLEARHAWPGPSVLLHGEESTRLGGALAGWEGANPLRLLLGPEGGLGPEERARCRDAGWRPASLGPRTLRFETAGVAAVAVAGDALGRQRESRSGSGDDSTSSQEER